MDTIVRLDLSVVPGLVRCPACAGPGRECQVDEQQQHERNPEGQVQLERIRLVKEAEGDCFDETGFRDAEPGYHHDHGQYQ